MIPDLYGNLLIATARKYPKKKIAKYAIGITSTQIILKYNISILDKSTKKQSNE